MSNPKTKRKTLGRGLSALLGDDAQSTEEAVVAIGGQTVPIEFLHPGKYQPRHFMDPAAISELAASIAAKGVLQPLLVRAHPDRDGEYEIIAGERRWRASQEAQLHEVPVIVKEFSDEEALEVGLVENLQREDLSPIEEADGYQRLVDEFYHTQEIMAKIVGKSRSHIANTMRLLSLGEDIKSMVESGELSAGHARALIGVDAPVPIAKKIIKDGMTVRQAEKLVSNASATSPSSSGAKSSAVAKDADTLALERNMTALLGLQVDIAARGSSGGVVTIHYKTLDQLDDVVHRLSNGPRGASSIPSDSGDISFSNDISDLNEIFESDGLDDLDGSGEVETDVESIEDIIADTEPEPESEPVSEPVSEPETATSDWETIETDDEADDEADDKADEADMDAMLMEDMDDLDAMVSEIEEEVEKDTQ